MAHFEIQNLKETQILGKIIAQHLNAPMIIYLNGDLGAGKTTLARAIIQNLGFLGNIKSPSYSIVEVYPFSRLYLQHFDFYCFTTPEEFEEAGFIEYFNEKSVSLIEWAENAAPFVPRADFCVFISANFNNENARKIELRAKTKKGEECLKKIMPQITDAFF